MSKEKEPVLVFVYGTLKQGCPLQKWMKKSKYLGDHTVKGYTLISLGPYPAMYSTEDEQHAVLGELYEMPADDFDRLAAMEESAGYQTVAVVTTEGVTAKAFILGTIHSGPVMWEQVSYRTGVINPVQ